jgi:hypothetical protein
MLTTLQELANRQLTREKSSPIELAKYAFKYTVTRVSSGLISIKLSIIKAFATE